MSISGELQLGIDGRRVARAWGRTSETSGFEYLGAIRLEAGPHQVSIKVTRGSFGPGMVAQTAFIGPLVLTPELRPPDASFLASSKARQACGRDSDWLESFASRP
jgi:hypothetical protein